MTRIQNLVSKIKDVVLPEWTVPVFIFFVCFFSFGILLSRLGFFQDDWHHVFYAYWQGAAGLQHFLFIDRGPFAYIVYAAFFKLLGFIPSHWHWSLMVIRFLTVIMFWLGVCQIWPTQSSLTTWLALFFAIYPIFALQTLSVAYTIHWVTYLMIMSSIFLMLFAVQHQKYYWPATILALILQICQLLLIEYYSGLELSRLIFLWFLFPDQSLSERLKKVFKYALPFLVVLVLYVIYRGSFGVIFGHDRFAPLRFLSGMLASPTVGVLAIVQFAIQDFVYIIFSPWYSAIDPSIIDLTRPSTYLILGSIFGFATLAFYLLSRLRTMEAGKSNPVPVLEILVGGLLSVILANIFFWLAGFSIFQKNHLWSDRLALASMGGASMILVSMVYTLVAKPAYRNLVLSVLLGLGVSLHVQTARSYQASTDKQTQFYWQLYWRAPALKPDTLVVADQEVLFFMGDYPTSFALNLLYPQTTNPPEASYWFNPGSPALSAGQSITFQKYVTTFSAPLENVVAITFQPEQDECLHILRPDYSNARGLAAEVYNVMADSNPSRIEPDTKSTPPPDIFGSEPVHGWCYYYEKADLASQFQNWNQIPGLWQAAVNQGVWAKNGIELLPFIQGYGMLNDWQTAHKITMQASVLPDKQWALLCDLWKNLGSATPSSSERDQVISSIQSRLQCSK